MKTKQPSSPVQDRLKTIKMVWAHNKNATEQINKGNCRSKKSSKKKKRKTKENLDRNNRVTRKKEI